MQACIFYVYFAQYISSSKHQVSKWPIYGFSCDEKCQKWHLASHFYIKRSVSGRVVIRLLFMHWLFLTSNVLLKLSHFSAIYGLQCSNRKWPIFVHILCFPDRPYLGPIHESYFNMRLDYVSVVVYMSVFACPAFYSGLIELADTFEILNCTHDWVLMKGPAVTQKISYHLWSTLYFFTRNYLVYSR